MTAHEHDVGFRVAAKCHHPHFELEQAPPVVLQAVQWEAQVFREIASSRSQS